MDKITFTRIWTWLAVVTLVAAVNAVLLDRGSPISLSGGISLTEQQGGPIPLGAVLYPLAFLTAYVGYRYAKVFGGKNFYERLPIAFGLSINFESQDGRNYQRTWFAFSWIVILSACIHLFVRFWQYRPIEKDTGKQVGFFSSNFSVFFNGNIYRYLGVSYYPCWEPWLAIFLFAVVCITFAAQLRVLFRKPAPVE